MRQVETAADGIEFDVRLSADGTWWLLHDQTLDKMTSASGASVRTDTELAALTIDGGLGYHGQRGYPPRAIVLGAG